MIVTINQTELKAALSVVSNIALSNKEANLSCIHLSANNGKLTVSATNPQQSARCSADALVEKEGELVVPARKFCDVCKTLPDEAVAIEAIENGLVTVKCGKIKFDIHSLDAYDFPGFSEFGETDNSNTVDIDTRVFAGMLRRCALGAAKDSNARPILNGVHIRVYDGMIYATATNSYIATQAKFGIKDKDASFCGVIPLAFAQKIGDTKECGTAKLSMSDRKCRVVLYSGAEFTTGLISGKYPDVDRIFPGEFDSEAKFSASALKTSISRARSLGGKDYIPINVEFDNDSAQVSSEVKSGESLEEDISCKSSGSGSFKVNASMLADAIDSVGFEDVNVCCLSPVDPITIKGINSRAIVMPVH